MAITSVISENKRGWGIKMGSYSTMTSLSLINYKLRISST